jgi:hypothetical protein
MPQGCLEGDHVTAVGDDSYYAERWADSRIGLYGQQTLRMVDRKIPDQAETDERADQEMLEQSEAARQAWLTYPPILGVELWDVLQVTDAGVGVSVEKFRVVEIKLIYDEDGTWGGGEEWYMELGLHGTT